MLYVIREPITIVSKVVVDLDKIQLSAEPIQIHVIQEITTTVCRVVQVMVRTLHFVEQPTTAAIQEIITGVSPVVRVMDSTLKFVELPQVERQVEQQQILFQVIQTLRFLLIHIGQTFTQKEHQLVHVHLQQLLQGLVTLHTIQGWRH